MRHSRPPIPTATVATRASRELAQQAARRLALFQRSGLVSARSSGAVISRATEPTEILCALRLVHDVYVESGYMLPDPAGLRLRVFEAVADNPIFIARIGDEVVGVMGLVLDSPDLGLPSDHAFGPELRALRAHGLRLCEATNLAIKPAYRRTSIGFDLLRPCCAQGVMWGCDGMFAAVSPQHVGFFRDVLQFVPLGDPRVYVSELGDRVQGMLNDLRTLEGRFREADRPLGAHAFLHNHFFASNPCFALVDPWAQRAARSFRDPGFLRHLFARVTYLPERCSPQQLEAIRRRWGADLFGEVFPELAEIERQRSRGMRRAPRTVSTARKMVAGAAA